MAFMFTRVVFIPDPHGGCMVLHLHWKPIRIIDMTPQPGKDIEVFPNPEPERPYTIAMDCPEFTCMCPRTGQPDFATIRIRYVPGERCIELKSLKLYLWSFRDEGAFHEAVVNKILDDLAGACQPRFMSIEGDFFVRGGIRTTVTATTGADPTA